MDFGGLVWGAERFSLLAACAGPRVLRGSRRVPAAAERASWRGSDRSPGLYAVEGSGEEFVR